MCLAVRAQGAAGILAGALAVGEPGSWALTTFCLASQEPQLLGAKSSVVSCLLEGPVQLGPGSVLQHCHLQGPVHIGTGCLVSGLDTAQCKALHGLDLYDLVLQGHHVRLHGTPSRVFTLVGRLDSWEVRCPPCLPEGSSPSPASLPEHWPEG